MKTIHAATILVLGFLLFVPNSALAHCDGMDGPVVKAAQAALETNDINLVLIWIQESDEPEVRQAFERTLAVRNLNATAREVADLYFFETLVRLHRAGEGAPFTGLKPAGRDLGPAIPLADEALTTGRVGPLVTLITNRTQDGLMERFQHARRAQAYSATDLEAGRAYVHAYVTFIHYVERAFEVATESAAGHLQEP